MTIYYLEVLQPGISFCLDSDISYYYHYQSGDIIKIHMYSDKGPQVVFGFVEYKALFNYNYSQVLLGISSLISLGLIADITKMVHRQQKLSELGI